MLKASRNAAPNVAARNQRYLGLGSTFEASEARLSRVVTTLADRAAAYWQPALASVLLAVFLGLSLVLPSLGLQVFNSPDETSDYIFTKTFAETGKLWYTKDYLALDNVQLQHPRGGLTDGNRVVFYSYLGLPVPYGLLYKVVGDNLQYISFVFAAVSAWALYRACALIFEAKAWEVWAVVLGFTPLIYYLNTPYFNATPALTLLFVSIWMFARYFRSSERRYMVLAAACAALVVAFRYEYVLFVTPLAAWALQIKHGNLRSREFAKDAGIYCGALLVLFAVPLLYLNRETYGSFTSYGPGLFNQIYFPDRTLNAGGSIVVRAFRTVWFMLFPSEVPNVPLLGKNLVRLTIGMAPLFTIAAMLGGIAIIKGRSLSLRQIGFMVVLAAYVLIYAGTTDTFQSAISLPSLRTSVVRYWLPVYTLAFFLGVYALRTHRGEALAYVLALGIVITGPLSVYRWTDGSLADLRSQLRSSTAAYEQEVMLNTEPNAVIYAGRSDKFIAPYRDVAAWWNSSRSYEVHMVADSMARVSRTGRPVYIVREPEVDIGELDGALAPYALDLAGVRGTNLYHLLPAPQFINPAGPPAPESIEPNAVVFTDEAGRLLVPSSAPSSWWQDSQEFSDTGTFAASLARVVSMGRPAYVLGNGSIDIDALNVLLADYGLAAVNVTGTQFYRIEAASSSSAGTVDCSALSSNPAASEEARQIYQYRCTDAGTTEP